MIEKARGWLEERELPGLRLRLAELVGSGSRISVRDDGGG